MAARLPSSSLAIPSTQQLAKKAIEVVLSLKVTGYDVAVTILCLFFPHVILRIIHRMYHWIVRIIDLVFRNERREQTEYDESLFRTLEQESRLLASITIGNILIKAIATILSMIGVIGPTVVPRTIQRLSSVLYFSWVASKIKAYTIARSQTRTMPFILKNEQRRFLYNRVSDIIIVFMCAATCLDILGVPLQSLLAFGGFGGLAVGLAAKELVENVLGGTLLAVVNPFVPGDVIKTISGGQELFGRVVKVGWYKTTILGVDQMPTDVPNQHFVSSRITNLSRLKHRRLQHSFYLRYADLGRVQTVVNGVRLALLDLPDIAPSIGFRVHFVGYSESKLNIEVTAFVKDEGIDKFYDTQQTALLEIARVVQEAGARFAYPQHAVNIAPQILDKTLDYTRASDKEHALENTNENFGRP